MRSLRRAQLFISDGVPHGVANGTFKLIHNRLALEWRRSGICPKPVVEMTLPIDERFLDILAIPFGRVLKLLGFLVVPSLQLIFRAGDVLVLEPW